jgi:hypothetical protein
LLSYCESDVVAVAKLLPAMLPQIDVQRALLRGRYMAAVSAIESTGIPIDVEILDRLKSSWEWIKSDLIRAVDRDYGVFVPSAADRTHDKRDPDRPGREYKQGIPSVKVTGRSSRVSLPGNSSVANSS